MTEEQKKFVARMLEAIDQALDVMPEYAANRLAITAQAALESGWGRSLLARRANNVFGVKAGRSWKGETLEMDTMEWVPGKGYHKVRARWRKYASLRDAVLDYLRIVNNLSWFKDALKGADPPAGSGRVEDWLSGLIARKNEPGWATDPQYFEKVKHIAEYIRSHYQGIA